MANDHARIRRDIWGDEDWRTLTSSAQWLYMHLLSSPTLTFAGIADWRPSRIAALSADLSASDVRVFAGELAEGRFILPDEDTEEVLIRSWVKHDGLLRSPNVTKALVKAHNGTASRILRAVLVDQLATLQEKGYDGAWNALGDLLEKPRLTFDEGVAYLSGNPSGKGSGNPSGDSSENRAPLRSPFSVLPSPRSISSPSDLESHQGGADDLGFGGSNAL